MKLLFKWLQIFLTFSFAFFLIFQSYNHFLKAQYPLKYYEYVLEFSQQYKIEPELVFAVIKGESDFDENAKSKAGAIGLMQIMPDTFEWLQSHFGIVQNEKQQLLLPKINIEYGVYLLYLLKEKFVDEKTILSAYNAGIGNVEKWLKEKKYSQDGIKVDTIPFKETNLYVQKVLDYKKMYKILYF